MIEGLYSLDLLTFQAVHHSVEAAVLALPLLLEQLLLEASYRFPENKCSSF